ncbi:MAG: cell division protein ZapA [Pseudomonadota bacterium]
MPEVRIVVGGREFDVACQEGEEHFLTAAADMLNAEAMTLIGQMGRMPEVRMLLMAGLMLADRSAGLEDQLRIAEERAIMAENALDRARASQNRVEVPVLPRAVIQAYAEIAERAEAIAADAERRAAG